MEKTEFKKIIIKIENEMDSDIRSFIQKTFNFFNKKYFNNKLLNIAILHVKGIINFNNILNAEPAFGNFRYHSVPFITISEISDFEIKNKKLFIKDVLLHEMIHYWLYSNEYIDENHGSKFIEKANQIAATISVRNITSDEEAMGWPHKLRGPYYFGPDFLGFI